MSKKNSIFVVGIGNRGCVSGTLRNGDKKSSDFSLLVNQLGLEPRTPSLKGMCSTC